VQAPNLPPKPLDRTFIASIMRNFDESWVPASGVDSRVLAQVSERLKEAEKRHKLWVEELQKKISANSELLRRFQVATGYRLEDWSVGMIASAIQIVMDNTERDSLIKKKQQFLIDHERQVKRLKEEIEVLENSPKSIDKQL